MSKDISKIKKNIFIIVRIIAFFVVLIFIMNQLSLVFFPKDKNGFNGDYYDITKSFLAEDPNTIDVFTVGNSDAYRGISPMIFWKNAGIASSVSGKGMQSTEDAYDILKAMYKKQNPKLVIIETDMIYSYWSDMKKHNGELNKIRDIWHIVSKFFVDFEDAAISGIGYYYPIISNHARWQELSINDFKNLKESYRSEYKGYLSDFNIESYKGNFDYMSADVPTEKLTKSEKDNLDKLIKLCRKHGSDVLLVELPSAFSWNQNKHLALQEYADSNKLNFIDFNIEGTLPTFDWSTDSKDGGDHMNSLGAQKISLFLIDYIKNNYEVPDKKSDIRYVSWNSCLNSYEKEYAEKGQW